MIFTVFIYEAQIKRTLGRKAANKANKKEIKNTFGSSEYGKYPAFFFTNKQPIILKISFLENVNPGDV